jgi:hypothetical protein
MLANLVARDGFFQAVLGDNDVFEALYYATDDCTPILRKYYRLILMDATYNTNRYGYPLVEIVVPTCFGTTMTVALVLVKNEKMVTYEWLVGFLCFDF